VPAMMETANTAAAKRTPSGVCPRSGSTLVDSGR
jgi:hypothetical protein